MQHLPVLYEEVLTQMDIKPDGVYLDCTFGRGGHSKGILDSLGKQGRLLAFDRDRAAIESDNAIELKKDPRFSLFHASFSELNSVVEQEGLVGKLDGILMDIGVSSPQLDDAERGFSFTRDGPLDMRMNATCGPTAAEWLQGVEEKELVQVLFDFGEERFARKIARAIVERREEGALQTTAQLAALVAATLPYREKHKHPATRTFQAVRIALNRELDELMQGMEQAVNVLKARGILAVISFHSLEDRKVKQFFKRESGIKHNPGRLPVREDELERGRLEKVSRAIKPTADEIELNPRARSAVLRVARKG